jgi:trans-2,3-dihydro-3-hydroxyanthranilate isomerase
VQRRYVTLDVFTRERFGGNPLAVVLDAAGLAPAAMQTLAREFGYSETTFVLPPRVSAHTAQVRIFTPTTEVPFAGHPNVGTAVALAHDMAARGIVPPDEFIFEEAAGLVRLALLREAHGVVGAEFRAPQPLSRGMTASAGEAALCLSLAAADVSTACHAPQVLSVGLPFLVVELASRAALRRAQPLLAEHQRILPPLGTDSVFAYVREAGAALLEARMFAPLDACVEDPATGSASAATLALLAALAPAASEVLHWQVRQGDDMGRPSRIRGRTARRADGGIDVFIAGHAVTVMQGSVATG